MSTSKARSIPVSRVRLIVVALLLGALLLSTVALSAPTAKAQVQDATLTIHKVTSPAGGTGFPFTVDPGPYSYSLQWGNIGVPRGIGTDAAGNVYVTNSSSGAGNYPVNKYDPSGSLLNQWGSNSGTAEGQFGSPYGVTTDAAGNVYVTDRDYHRIQKFDSSGAFLLMWGWGVQNGSNVFQICTTGCQAGILGSGDGQFNLPADVAVDAAGNVYVVDQDNRRIQKFTSGGAFLMAWGSNGSGDGQFSTPTSVAVDAAGDVYVVDPGNVRVQKFTSSGAFLLKWGSNGSAEGGFAIPQAVAVDAAGNVYVADGLNNRVQKFDSSGAFLSMWGWGVDDGTAVLQTCVSGCQAGLAGSGNGQFNFALDVAVNAGGTVYVLDNQGGQRRIQAFDPALTTVLNDGESHTFTLLPGTYLVSELVPAGWEVTSIDCRDPARGPATRSITLAAGDVRRCIFTNTQIPTAITLASFDAAAQADHALVTWETVSELNNAGFNLYRTTSEQAPSPADLQAYVPSQVPGSAQGYAYSYPDYAVTAGQAYWYWLEDVDFNGATTMHGPVSVVFVNPTAVTLSRLEAATDQSAALAWPWLLAAIVTALALAVGNHRRSRA